MKLDANSIRKAAILVSTLDAASADALLEQLADEQAAAVRHAVMQLDDIDPQEQQRVVGEFLGKRTPTETTAISGDAGVELDPSLAQLLQSPVAIAAPALRTATEAGPFRLLQQTPAEELLSVLQHEHPQTLALVVANLQPQQAAEVLARLPGPLQQEVVRRITDLEETDPDVMREIEQGLASLLRGRWRTGPKQPGLAIMQSILAAAPPEARQRIMNSGSETPSGAKSEPSLPSGPSDRPGPQRMPRWDNLSTTARKNSSESGQRGIAEDRPGDESRIAPTELARPKLHPLDFTELTRLDDASLARVLQAAGNRLMLLALAGASEQLMRRIYGCMPPRDAQTLRRRIEQQGPIRLRDVDEAQRRIGEIAGTLAQQSKIVAPLRRDKVTR